MHICITVYVCVYLQNVSEQYYALLEKSSKLIIPYEDSWFKIFNLKKKKILYICNFLTLWVVIRYHSFI